MKKIKSLLAALVFISLSGFSYAQTLSGTGLEISSNVGDWGFGAKINVKTDFGRALYISSDTYGKIFEVVGNGIVHAGKIYAKAIEVLTDPNGIYWWDIVFKPGYDLMPLSEVEQFVNTNHHLPDIPSEKEVFENGVNLLEMDGLLLKKIEELTLYTIQQQKEIDELKKVIDELKAALK